MEQALPNGESFALSDETPGAYLHHSSHLGDFALGSDSVVPSFTRWKRMASLMANFPEEEHEAFRTIGYTIGGMIVFPTHRVDGQPTVNAARGFNDKIADRMDLTLECIRRFYRGESSPFANTLIRYADFFSLFGDFTGYVDFFLLDDMVDETGIRFFMPFDDFKSPPVPQDVETYRSYRRLSIEWIEARNRRIDALQLVC